MQQKEISRGASIAITAAFVILMFGLFWWSSSARKSGKAYSDRVAQQESSEAYIRAQQQEAQRKATLSPEAERERPRDQDYQPENETN